MDIIHKLIRLENEASGYGFNWEKPEQILAQIQSELAEVKVHLMDGNRAKLAEEIGDLMHAVFSLCVFCQFEPEKILQYSVNKFERRFELVKHLAQEQGLNHLKGLSFDQLMQFWDRAKQLEDKKT